eukprot:2615521-Rhodomonas_salina.1
MSMLYSYRLFVWEEGEQEARERRSADLLGEGHVGARIALAFLVPQPAPPPPAPPPRSGAAPLPPPSPSVSPPRASSVSPHKALHLAPCTLILAPRL